VNALATQDTSQLDRALDPLDSIAEPLPSSVARDFEEVKTLYYTTKRLVGLIAHGSESFAHESYEAIVARVRVSADPDEQVALVLLAASVKGRAVPKFGSRAVFEQANKLLGALHLDRPPVASTPAASPETPAAPVLPPQRGLKKLAGMMSR